MGETANVWVPQNDGTDLLYQDGRPTCISRGPAMVMWEQDGHALRRVGFSTGDGYLAYEFVDENRQGQLLAELKQIINFELADLPGECSVRLRVEVEVRHP